MNLTIFGASRGIGYEVLTQALEDDFKVTVLLRKPEKLQINHDNLAIIKGDFLDYLSVKETVKEADAIVVSVGTIPSWKPVTLFSTGTRHLLQAIYEGSRTPLVLTVTGIGAGDSRGHGSFFYNKLFQPMLLKRMYEDKDRQEAILMQAYKKWIIVRPGMLTNGKQIGSYRILTNYKNIRGGKISRADTAHFILTQIKQPSYIGKTPLLIY